LIQMRVELVAGLREIRNREEEIAHLEAMLVLGVRAGECAQREHLGGSRNEGLDAKESIVEIRAQLTFACRVDDFFAFVRRDAQRDPKRVEKRELASFGQFRSSGRQR
jgi:hypothetical protein